MNTHIDRYIHTSKHMSEISICLLFHGPPSLETDPCASGVVQPACAWPWPVSQYQVWSPTPESLSLMIIAFITWNSHLVPLIEGLSGSNPCRFDFLVFVRIKSATGRAASGEAAPVTKPPHATRSTPESMNFFFIKTFKNIFRGKNLAQSLWYKTCQLKVLSVHDLPPYPERSRRDYVGGIMTTWGTSPPPILQIHSLYQVAMGTPSHVPLQRRAIIIAIFSGSGTNCTVPSHWDLALKCVCGPNFRSI